MVMPRIIKAAVAGGKLIGGGGPRKVPLSMGRYVVGHVAPDGTFEWDEGVDVDAKSAMKQGLVNKVMVDGSLYAVVIPSKRRNR